MVTEEYEEGQLVEKTACPYCDSSDAYAVYDNGRDHCFSCNTTVNHALKLAKVRGGGWSQKAYIGNDDDPKKQEVLVPFTPITPSELPKVTFRDFPKRGIKEAIAKQFHYGTHSGKHCAIYYDTNDKPVAAKFRTRDKKFTWAGSPKDAALFGMQLFHPNKNLKLVITEGEIDALSVAQAQNKLYPVISLKDGASSAKRAVKDHYEYLNGFKEIIIMFDMDEVGQEAALEVAKMFPPKYAKIAKLRDAKDANELLVKGRGDEIVEAIFSAEPYTPANLKSGAALMDLFYQEDNTESYPLLPFTPLLNKKMFGTRLGELTIITAGSGSGKTTFVKELQYHYFSNTKLNQGIIHLEEKPNKTMLGLISIALKRRVHLTDWRNDLEVKAKWQELSTATDSEGNNRLNVYDAFGTIVLEDLYESIRYLAKVEMCQLIYLDHISMLVSGMPGNIDERKALDNIMTELASLTQELNIHIFGISHLNNDTKGKPFEEGNRATVNNLRGSGALKQLAFNIISLTRNQMADCAIERNTIQVDLLKCRETGDTGASDKVFYNSETGCLESLEDSPFDSSKEKDF